MRIFITTIVIGIGLACFVYPNQITVGQGSITATPVPVSIPSPLPFSNVVDSSPTPAIVTSNQDVAAPTMMGQAMLEALSEANIRSQPDPNSERLGTIRTGTLYPVLGRYYRWYQFQYDLDNGNSGWVYDELVRIVGDVNSITDLAEQEQLNATPNVDATSTVFSLQQTPGGIETATAGFNSVPLPILPSSTISSFGSSPTPPVTIAIRATFTIPASISVASTPPIMVPQGQNEEQNLLTALPPIVPILMLGGFGILGLVFSSYRK